MCVDAVRGVSAIRIEMVRIAKTSPSHPQWGRQYSL